MHYKIFFFFLIKKSALELWKENRQEKIHLKLQWNMQQSHKEDSQAKCKEPEETS